jgi:hypothetical protein
MTNGRISHLRPGALYPRGTGLSTFGQAPLSGARACQPRLLGLPKLHPRLGVSGPLLSLFAFTVVESQAISRRFGALPRWGLFFSATSCEAKPPSRQPADSSLETQRALTPVRLGDPRHERRHAARPCKPRRGSKRHLPIRAILDRASVRIEAPVRYVPRSSAALSRRPPQRVRCG